MTRAPTALFLLAFTAVVSACRQPVDYSDYLERFPRSVLVLPPLGRLLW